MRATVYDWFSTDPTIAGIVADRIFPVNTIDDKPTTPYLVYRMSVATPRTVPARNQILQVWGHDLPGDYTVIDNLLEAVEQLLKSKDNEGAFYEASWLDTSDDLFDEIAHTIFRYARFQLVLKEE